MDESDSNTYLTGRRVQIEPGMDEGDVLGYDSDEVEVCRADYERLKDVKGVVAYVPQPKS